MGTPCNDNLDHTPLLYRISAMQRFKSYLILKWTWSLFLDCLFSDYRTHTAAFSSSLSPQKSKRVRGSSPPSTITQPPTTSTKASTTQESTRFNRSTKQEAANLKTDDSYSAKREPIVIPDSPSPVPSVITISSDSEDEPEKLTKGYVFIFSLLSRYC